MNNYKGVIIEESLEDKAIFKKVKILYTKVKKVTRKNKTPWLSQWTLHTIEIPKNQAQIIAEEISRILDSKHGGSWYADFKNNTHHFIIFLNKIFFIDRRSKKQYDSVKQYGISLGIPEYQLDFYPEVKKRKKSNMKLTHQKTSTLYPKPPFNFDGTVNVFPHFPVPDFEWRKSVCWQAINFGGKSLGLKMENKGNTNNPKIKLTIYSKKKSTKQEIKNILDELNWRYGFKENISEFCEKFKNDKFLRKAIRNWKGLRINCSNSLYELLMIAIVLQNTVVRRTVQMMNALLEKYGTLLSFDNKKLYAYWKPQDLDEVKEDDLRKFKVGYRAKMIKKISKSFSREKINEFKLRKTPLDEAKNELLKLYGVGPATAQILVGEYFRNYETFDLKGRLWEQKLLSKILFNKKMVPEKKILNELDKRYSKWKYLACHYLFQDLFWRHIKKKIDWLEKEIRM